MTDPVIGRVAFGPRMDTIVPPAAPGVGPTIIPDRQAIENAALRLELAQVKAQSAALAERHRAAMQAVIDEARQLRLDVERTLETLADPALRRSAMR